MSLSTSEIRNGINIRGMIDLDQMAGLFTNLLDRVDRQNEVISNLQETVQQLVSRDQLNNNFAIFNKELEKINSRLDQVFQSASTRINDHM